MSKPYHVEDHQMSFTEHLGELRTRLLIASLAVIFCSIFGFTYAKEIIGFLMGPLKDATAGTNIQPDLHYLSLTEPLFQSFKIALFAGIFFAFPIWIWQIWLFIAPGLHKNERRLIGPVLTSSILLFVGGATFAYKIAVPAAYRFLLIYASPLQAQPTAPVRQGGLTLELLPIPTPPKAPKHKTATTDKSSKHPVLQVDLPALQALLGLPTTSSTHAKTPIPSTLPTSPKNIQRSHTKAPIPPSQTSHTKQPVSSAKTTPAAKPILRLRAHNLFPPTDPKRVDLLQAVQTLLRQKSLDLQLTGSSQRFQLRYQWDYPHPSEEAWGQLKPNLTLQAYLGISSWFLLGFGLVFQTPLVIFLLGIFGIAPPELLGQYRRHAFIIILIISSVLTPTGDPLNLMIMALPMYILFEIGLAVARIFLRYRKDDDDSSPTPPSTPPSPPSTPPSPPTPTPPSLPTAEIAQTKALPSPSDLSPEEAQAQEQQEGDLFLQNDLQSALFAYTSPPSPDAPTPEQQHHGIIPPEATPKPPILPTIRPPEGAVMARGSLTQTEPDPGDLDEFVEFDEASTQPTETQAETETLQSTETQVETLTTSAETTSAETTSAETTSAETTSAETESSEISQPSEGEASKKKDDIP